MIAFLLPEGDHTPPPMVNTFIFCVRAPPNSALPNTLPDSTSPSTQFFTWPCTPRPHHQPPRMHGARKKDAGRGYGGQEGPVLPSRYVYAPGFGESRSNLNRESADGNPD